MTTLRDKISGSLYGLLVGDALGCSVEGFSREDLDTEVGLVDRMMDGIRRWRPAGLHSDDGQQALALCDAVLATPSAPTLAFAKHLVALREEGPSGFRRFGLHRGTGANFRSTVMALKKGAPLTKDNVYAGSKETAGNGAAMRVAPLALFYRDDEERLLDQLVATARVTHRDARGIAAAATVAWCVKTALTSTTPLSEWSLEPLLHFVRRCEDKCDALFSTTADSHDMSRVLAVVVQHLNASQADLLEVIEREASACTSSPVRAGVGFCVASVATSVAFFLRAKKFKHALQDIIAVGDDTDTTAAMVGAMCGAYFGREAIPEDWLDDLHARAMLDDRVLALEMRWPSFKPSFSLTDLESRWCEALWEGPPESTDDDDGDAAPAPEPQLSLVASAPIAAVEDDKEDNEDKKDNDVVDNAAEAAAEEDESIANVEDASNNVAADAVDEDEDEDEDELDEELPFWMDGDEDAANAFEDDDVEPVLAAGDVSDTEDGYDAQAQQSETVEDDNEAATLSPDVVAAEPAAEAAKEPVSGGQMSIFDALAQPSPAQSSPAQSASLAPITSTPTEAQAKPAAKATPEPQPTPQAAPVEAEPAAEPTVDDDKPTRQRIPREFKTHICLEKGDITKTRSSAIVNAANTSLLGGGGVDGAIHRAGGPAILDECKDVRARQGGCKTGEAVITTAGKLPADKVIHTVGPRWRGGDQGEADLLQNAYVSSLELARQNGLRTVAFPSISTGVYRYPIERAAPLALATVSSYLNEFPNAFDEVRFVLFDAPDLWVYEKALTDVLEPPAEVS